MGAKINMENRQDDLERRLKLVEDALEELVQTRVHHIDLTEDIEVKPDEEFTPPTGRRKIEDSPIGAGFTHKDTKAKKSKAVDKEKVQKVESIL